VERGDLFDRSDLPDQLTIPFFSRGQFIGEGRIVFAGGSGGADRIICLPGFFYPIVAQPYIGECDEFFPSSFTSALTEQTERAL